MRLYLVQHGQAKSENVDPQRHLTAQGLRDVQKVSAFLRPLKLKAPAIWHSGKPRAQQTADILAAAISPRRKTIKRAGLEPDDPIKPIRRAVERARTDVMIVGHLPFLARLAARLLAGKKSREIIAFQYAGVVCLERDDAGGWTMAWMILPQLIG